MINRQNWLDIRAYLHHIQRVRQNSQETVKRARAHLRHLLEWADETPLPAARKIDPTFPTYLLSARCDGKDQPLAPASISKCLTNARQFFSFARTEWPLRYKSISESWIELLYPPRSIRNSRIVRREFWTLEDALKIASVSAETLREERGKVAVCMLFLSGMRASALASLPISCVDLPNRTIYQLPERGVHTKNHKAAITYLLEIPELLNVVEAWDRRVRAELPSSALWYSTLSRDGMRLTQTVTCFDGRNSVIEHDLRLICARANVHYLSPHKLRHGHVVFALKHSNNLADLKAISQNVMHASVVITDQIYGRLMNDDVQKTITSLIKS
jgi:site-specific recombinase XerD